jgi:hypothetical protein
LLEHPGGTGRALHTEKLNSADRYRNAGDLEIGNNITERAIRGERLATVIGLLSAVVRGGRTAACWR